jgi:hypothetical protein
MFDHLLSSWEEALKNAQCDPAVSVSVAALTMNGLFDLYVASLPPNHSIAAHVHAQGNEYYFIIHG